MKSYATMPRRSKRTADFPTNLYPNGAYFQYRMPDGKAVSLGKDKELAFKRAKLLNERLQKPDDIDRLIKRSKNRILLSRVIEEFWALRAPDFNWSQRTAAGRRAKTNYYVKHFPSLHVDQMTVRWIADFLNAQIGDAYLQHRIMLVQLLEFAVSQGYAESNLAERTLKRKQGKRKRQRHTMDGFWAAYDHADDWLQRAMLIGLYSLQRESDIVAMRKSQVDRKRRTIKVLQGKTKNYAHPVYIEIQCGPKLWEAIERCIKSPIVCPFLINKQFKGRSQGDKPHKLAVTPNYLSRAFTAARDRSGYYDDMEPEERPTFHDIRALGIYRYKQMGISPGEVNSLSGHSSDAMREHYVEGHELPPAKLVRAD